MRHEKETPKLGSAIFTMGIIALVLVWGTTALTNEDPLWFVHRFEGEAEAITIYWDGQSTVIGRGERGYSDLMTAFGQAIARPAGFEWEVAFSEQSIESYQQRFRMLKVTFPQPVQVHTRHPFPRAATYLIPLNETHAYSRRVFAFTGIVPYASGPLNLSEPHFDALYKAVEAAVTVM